MNPSIQDTIVGTVLKMKAALATSVCPPLLREALLRIGRMTEEDLYKMLFPSEVDSDASAVLVILGAVVESTVAEEQNLRYIVKTKHGAAQLGSAIKSAKDLIASTRSANHLPNVSITSENVSRQNSGRSLSMRSVGGGSEAPERSGSGANVKKSSDGVLTPPQEALGPSSVSRPVSARSGRSASQTPSVFRPAAQPSATPPTAQLNPVASLVFDSEELHGLQMLDKPKGDGSLHFSSDNMLVVSVMKLVDFVDRDFCDMVEHSVHATIPQWGPSRELLPDVIIGGHSSEHGGGDQSKDGKNKHNRRGSSNRSDLLDDVNRVRARLSHLAAGMGQLCTSAQRMQSNWQHVTEFRERTNHLWPRANHLPAGERAKLLEWTAKEIETRVEHRLMNNIMKLWDSVFADVQQNGFPEKVISKLHSEIQAHYKTWKSAWEERCIRNDEAGKHRTDRALAALHSTVQLTDVSDVVTYSPPPVNDPNASFSTAQNLSIGSQSPKIHFRHKSSAVVALSSPRAQRCSSQGSQLAIDDGAPQDDVTKGRRGKKKLSLQNLFSMKSAGKDVSDGAGAVGWDRPGSKKNRNGGPSPIDTAERGGKQPLTSPSRGGERGLGSGADNSSFPSVGGGSAPNTSSLLSRPASRAKSGRRTADQQRTMSPNVLSTGFVSLRKLVGMGRTPTVISKSNEVRLSTGQHGSTDPDDHVRFDRPGTRERVRTRGGEGFRPGSSLGVSDSTGTGGSRGLEGIGSHVANVVAQAVGGARRDTAMSEELVFPVKPQLLGAPPARLALGVDEYGMDEED